MEILFIDGIYKDRIYEIDKKKTKYENKMEIEIITVKCFEKEPYSYMRVFLAAARNTSEQVTIII